MAPLSYEKLPADLVESCFNQITSTEIKAPATRSLTLGSFDISEMMQEIKLRRLSSPEQIAQTMTADEFINSTDLA